MRQEEEPMLLADVRCEFPYRLLLIKPGSRITVGDRKPGAARGLTGFSTAGSGIDTPETQGSA
jgi:hypothetical protein